ncbi:hypothetical protein FCE95_15250 [Luteimonas gilva]|uniref:Uncharacterized protein n=1 Tax=Luteimonas gilva TaxID=2572684 RepID=A0A4U5JIX7_9GAMM|nr:hypothetical protein [Luteimonas gilva]TKR29492.1 hypothetical protein FCE95_15250 [Luteimonas gilva]
MPIHPVRIPTPLWARPTDASLYDGVRLSDYHLIQSHRDRLLDAVHDELDAYLNSDAIFGAGDFPNRERLTGEYYIADESYAQHTGPLWIQIGIKCHCLEYPINAGQIDLDYLGLEVWLRFEPASGAFSIFRNTDSSSI